jgi:autotransporter-associated beta strand protein
LAPVLAINKTITDLKTRERIVVFMKHPALKFLTPAIAGLCLGLVPNASKASVLYFDPEGATQVTTGGTYTWDTTSLEWSTTSSLSGTLVAWNSTDAACFVAGAGFTGNITVDVNSAINDAGIFDGNLGPSGCNLTLAGTGSLAFGSGAQAFGAGGSDGNSITMDIPITDGPGGPAAPESEEATVNTINLYTPNTFTGGFILGSSSNGTGNGGVADGGVAFNNSQAFGTGAISSTSSTATREIYTPLAAQTGAINLANNFSLWNGIFEYAGVSTAPVTISGTVSLSTAGTTSTIQVQSTKDVGAGNAILTIAGGITGAGNLAKAGPGTLVLAGGSKNTYTGSTTITAGTLFLKDQNEISTSSGLILGGGKLDPGGNSQNFGTLATSGTGTTSIDFEDGDFVTLDFLDSHTQTWTGAINLVNYNGGTGTDWNGSGDVINFGSQTGLTAGELQYIEFNGVANEAALDSSGNLYQLAFPVPEPSSIALGLLGGLGVFLMRRKKA